MPDRLPLSRLLPGDTGVIAAVDGPEGLRQRLAALGFRADRAVRLVRQGTLSVPLHVRLGTTDVALRRVDAGLVAVWPAPAPAA